MKVRRNYDKRDGWAIEMTAPFTFAGRPFPYGGFIVEVAGERDALTASAFYKIFTPICEAVA